MVRRIEEAGGELTVELHNTGIFQDKYRSYKGYGYSATQAMEGELKELVVQLVTTEIGIKRETHPMSYKGYGYCWAQSMEGEFAGNEFTLEATEVNQRKESHSSAIGAVAMLQ